MGPRQKETPIKYCAYCGAKMERVRYPSKLEDMRAFMKRKYCCRDCMKKAYVKKDSEYQMWGAAHGSARKIVYLIEGREKRCELCGSTKNVDVHHKDGNYFNNSSENLMIICRSCHNRQHKTKVVCKLCGRPIKGHGLCNMHYIRFKRYGDPLYYQGRVVSNTFTERKKSQGIKNIE